VLSVQPFDFQLKTRLIFGAGSAARLGEVAHGLHFSRTLLVSDRGLLDAGHVERAITTLAAAGVEALPFHDFEVNPDTEMVKSGAAYAKSGEIDSIVGLGGGSSLDCAKGINFLLTNGGEMADYRGYGKTTMPLLPMVAVPTTAGTGSEAQSYAVISDAATHVKMACGATDAGCRVAVLDPELTLSQPPFVAAAAGFDAIAHAVETAVTTRRNEVSRLFSHEAFRLLNHHFERVLDHPDDLDARSAMQLGAFYAGVAIEQSMLGAAHACANPLTAQCQMTHGVALAILLPHIVRWNAATSGALYRDLAPDPGSGAPEAEAAGGDQLSARLVEIGRVAGFPTRLRDEGVEESDLQTLAEAAAEQWTGTFNPRAFGRAEALEVYQCAY
jgi:alcohol dehydrogenase